MGHPVAPAQVSMSKVEVCGEICFPAHGPLLLQVVHDDLNATKV